MPDPFTELFSSVANDPSVQAKAVAVAIGAVMGFTPRVVSGPGYAEVVFTAAQEDAMVAYINNLLSSGPRPAAGGASVTPKASKVRINVKMILARVFLKNYWYVLAGPFVGGFLTGRNTAKRK